MKIAITGANSFIGQHLSKRLMEDEHIELILVSSHDIEGIGLKTVHLDMEQYGYLGDAIGPVDCLVNLAWKGTRGLSRNNREEQEFSRNCTLAAIQSSLKHGCRKVVLAGSQAEYGSVAGLITEEMECNPNTEYGKSKLQLYGDALNLCHEYNAQCIEPRFFSLYGPGDYQGTMVISILKKMIQGEDCDLTQGIQMWDFLYIDDAVSAIHGIICKEIHEGCYNIGNGGYRQLREFILEMKEVSKSRSKLNFGAIPYPDTGVVSICPDVSKLKISIGWRPQVNFKDGIGRVLLSLESE